jgi:DNA anti-recombination protein RmuC
MGRRESRRAAELQKLRAELVKQLDRLDFRSESIGPALAKMAQHVERTIRKLTA